MSSIEIKKEYIDEGRCDVLGRGFFRLLEEMYEVGFLTRKPSGVVIKPKTYGATIKDSFEIHVNWE